MILAESQQNSPTLVPLCLQGLDRKHPVDLVVSRPDGSKAQSDPTISESGYVYFTVLPGDPQGDYSIRVRQNATEIAATVSVHPVSYPRVMLVTDAPALGPRLLGETLRFAVGGFPPNRLARIFLYRKASGENELYDYATQLSAMTDQYGQGRFDLPTSESDSPGCYNLQWLNPNTPTGQDGLAVCLERS